MKKKIFIAMIILSILGIICLNYTKSEAYTHSGSVRQFIGKSYTDLNGYSFGDFSTEDWLYNSDAGVICIHDAAYEDSSSWCSEHGKYCVNCHYQLGKKFSGWYYYYDKISLNPGGKEMGTIYYNNDSGTNKNEDSYLTEVTFLSRMFYEYRTSSGLDSEYLLNEYRLYCLNKMSNGFKNWFNVSGSFQYFVHKKSLTYTNYVYDGIGHYYTGGKTLYEKSKVYSDFIKNMNSKYTIANKGYTTVSSAISGKETLATNTSTNWNITVNAPYYPSGTAVYDGVTYKYAFIDTSAGTSIDWNTANTLSSSLASGSGVGYKSVKLSGVANTNADANMLVIQCSYPTYTGLAMGFATDSGQERFLVSGKKNSYNSYIAYEIKNDPNVTISKKIVDLNATPKNTTSINVEPGDTVIFKVVVKNTGAATKVNISDSIPTGLTLSDVGTESGGTITWYPRTSWAGLTDKDIGKDKEIVRYFKCKVNDDATGTITNKAKVTPSTGYKLNENNDSKKEASASVTVLGYSYSLNKTVSKALVEPGDTVNYTITLTNNNSTKLHNMIIEDTIPAGLEYVSSSVDCGNWNTTQSGSTLKFTRTSTPMGSGSCTFTIQCKVPNSSISTTNTTVTNTAYLTKIQNRNGLDLDTKNSSATTTILGYSYSMAKVVNAIYKSDNSTNTGSITEAEPGDIVQYKITISNTGSGELHNIKVEDIIPSGMSYYSKSTSWSKNGNIYTYNSTLASGNSVNLYIKAKVNDTLSNTIHTETNTAKISTVENKNSVDITTVTESSATVSILGYNGTLEKYITKHNTTDITGRNSKTNAERNDSPIVVKKGDTLTYTILFKNTGTAATTGNTTLYTPEIIDELPGGIEYVSHSSGWSKTGNTYTYNNNVGIGEEAKLEINCRVTMSNMYLPNIENTATFGNINNRNNINTASVLNQEKNKEYVRLDELLIAGNVWKDDNRDGLNNSENGIEKILVYLRDANNDSIVSKTTTDVNGDYKFEQVIKGTNKDVTTGNYDKTTSEYKQYYIEFVYDGIDYRSTIYTGSNANSEKGQGHLTGNGKYEADYIVDSNAIEKYSDRALINNALERISYNEANGTKGSIDLEIDLEYEKNDNNSTIKKDVLKNNLKAKLGSELKNIDSSDLAANNIVVNISSYSFMDESGNRDNLWLYTNITSTATEGYMPETDYLQHINLGLTTRDGFDLSLTNKVEKIRTVVNGQSMEYSFSDQNINDINEFVLYNADYAYRHDDYNIRDNATNEIINAETNLSPAAYSEMQNIVSGLKTPASELNVFVTFKTTVTNNSTYAYAKVNEIAQFYDDKFKELGQNVDIGLDANKNGVIEPAEIETKETTAEDSSGVSISISQTSSVTYSDNALNGLNVLYINTDDILAPGESKDIYITYIVDKDSATRNLKINDGTGADRRLQYISIIGQYSSYDDASGTKIAGLIDDNSNPGNLGLRNTSESPTKDVKDTEDATKKYSGQNYSEKYFENDTHISGVKFELNYSRKIKGLTWRDARTDSIDGQDVGNGRYIETDGDVVIGGITVQLVEIINNGNDYYEIIRQQTTSNTDGTYTINDFIPGNYIVRFRYGGSDASIQYDGQDYKSTTYTLNPETYEGLTQANISDARDDELRRLEVMNYSLEMYNERAEILKATETSEEPLRTALKDNTKMFADTIQFFSEYELLGTDAGKMKVKSSISKFDLSSGNWEIEAGIGYNREFDYEIENIDFGIQERPECRIELDKYIKQIKLETSSGELLVDLQYDENSNLIESASKGFENVQALNNIEDDDPATPGDERQQGFRYINMDEEILQGAKITIIYGFKVTNQSEVDHVGSNLYGEQEAIEDLRTVGVLERMTDAIGDLHNLDLPDITSNPVSYEIKKNNYKYRMSRLGGTSYSYGYYLGDIYYIGTNSGLSNDVVATIKVDNILDYVDNDLVFSQMDNGGKWEAAASEKELIIDGYLNPNVATYIDTTRPEGDQMISYQDLIEGGFEYYEDADNYGFRPVGGTGIEIEGAILDINSVGYQKIDGTGEEIKNNLAITVDSSDLNGTLSKHIYPDGSGDPEATTELMVSKYLSSENESDEMVYENIAEIIKFTTLTGRRTVDEQTVGNAKMRMAGYVNSDATLGEPDTSITEKVMLTPPTGGEMIDSYGITKVIIYVTASIGAIVLGILFIPKLVTKIKNRKFVK